MSEKRGVSTILAWLRDVSRLVLNIHSNLIVSFVTLQEDDFGRILAKKGTHVAYSGRSISRGADSRT